MIFVNEPINLDSPTPGLPKVRMRNKSQSYYNEEAILKISKETNNILSFAKNKTVFRFGTASVHISIYFLNSTEKVEISLGKFEFYNRIYETFLEKKIYFSDCPYKIPDIEKYEVLDVSLKKEFYSDIDKLFNCLSIEFDGPFPRYIEYIGEKFPFFVESTYERNKKEIDDKYPDSVVRSILFLRSNLLNKKELISVSNFLYNVMENSLTYKVKENIIFLKRETIFNDLFFCSKLFHNQSINNEIKNLFKLKTKKALIKTPGSRKDFINMIYNIHLTCFEKQFNSKPVDHLFPNSFRLSNKVSVKKNISKMLNGLSVEITNFHNKGFVATLRSNEKCFDFEVLSPFNIDAAKLLDYTLKTDRCSPKDDMELCNLDMAIKVYEKVLRNLGNHINDFLTSNIWLDVERWVIKRNDGESLAKASLKWDTRVKTLFDATDDICLIDNFVFLRKLSEPTEIGMIEDHTFITALNHYLSYLFNKKVVKKNKYVCGKELAEVIAIYQLIMSFFCGLYKRSLSETKKDQVTVGKFWNEVIKFAKRTDDKRVSVSDVRRLFGFCEYGCQRFIELYALETKDGTIKPVDLMIQVIFKFHRINQYASEVKKMYQEFMLPEDHMVILAKSSPGKRLQAAGVSQSSLNVIASFRMGK